MLNQNTIRGTEIGVNTRQVWRVYTTLVNVASNPQFEGQPGIWGQTIKPNIYDGNLSPDSWDPSKNRVKQTIFKPIGGERADSSPQQDCGVSSVHKL